MILSFSSGFRCLLAISLKSVRPSHIKRLPHLLQHVLPIFCIHKKLELDVPKFSFHPVQRGTRSTLSLQWGPFHTFEGNLRENASD